MQNVPLKLASPRHAKLAQKIIEAASSGDWSTGRHVTEEDLVRILGVSRSPVRAALRVLAEHGIVEARPRRGALLTRPGRELTDIVLDGRMAVEESLRLAMLRDRLAGELAAVQSQAEMARRYDVGLPTLQRVLERMQQEGLVERTGWHWSFPRTLQARTSQAASYEIRLMLEPQSLLLPTFQANTAALEKMLADHAALLEGAKRSPERIFELDARFHETLAEWGGNPFIVNVIRQQNALRTALEMESYADQARVAAWGREHVLVLEAISRQSIRKASRMLKTHLETARAKMLAEPEK